MRFLHVIALSVVFLNIAAPCEALSDCPSGWTEDEHDAEVQKGHDGPVENTPESSNDALLMRDDGQGQTIPSSSSTGFGASILDQISALEQKVFGRTFETSEIAQRLADLETASFNGTKDPASTSVESRINALSDATASIPAAQAPRMSGIRPDPWRWLKNPPRMPMVDALGRGLKNTGKGFVSIPRTAADTTQKVLTSPQFWGAAALGGAAVGGYFLLKHADKHAATGGGTYGAADAAGGTSSNYSAGYGSNSLGNQNPYGYDPYAQFQPYGQSSSPIPVPQGSSFGYSAVSPGCHWVSGYTNKYGTYVEPHRQTNADGTKLNNWSTRGNVNPFTGKKGYKKAF